MRALALYNFCMSTICRADEARSKLLCQQLIFCYALVPNTIGSCQQDLQYSIFSMTSGKTNAGDTKEYRVAGRRMMVSSGPCMYAGLNQLLCVMTASLRERY